MSRPWVSGPAELLEHGLDHLSADTDLDRRLALIAVDNAVELAIKTFLTLPKRAPRSPGLSRRQQSEVVEGGFPALLDALEKHASAAASEAELCDFEFYHRLRNQLYHGGAGLTVERQKVEMYADLAQLLFRNLFDYEIGTPRDDENAITFLVRWSEIERLLNDKAIVASRTRHRQLNPAIIARMLRGREFREEFADRIIDLNSARNELVHAAAPPSGLSVSAMTREATALLEELRALVEATEFRPSPVQFGTPADDGPHRTSAST